MQRIEYWRWLHSHEWPQNTCVLLIILKSQCTHRILLTNAKESETFNTLTSAPQYRKTINIGVTEYKWTKPVHELLPAVKCVWCMTLNQIEHISDSSSSLRDESVLILNSQQTLFCSIDIGSNKLKIVKIYRFSCIRFIFVDSGKKHFIFSALQQDNILAVKDDTNHPMSVVSSTKSRYESSSYNWIEADLFHVFSEFHGYFKSPTICVRMRYLFLWSGSGYCS